MNGWRFEISRNKIILSHFNNDKKRIKFLIIFHSRCQCFKKKKVFDFFVPVSSDLFFTCVGTQT